MFTITEINAAIEAMAKSQAGASRSIARVIVMAAWAANVNADPAVANALMKNLRKGVKKSAVVETLQTIANLAYVSGTFAFFDAHKDYSDESAALIKVKAAGWEDAKGKTEVKQLDFADELAAFVKRMKKADTEKRLSHADLLVRAEVLSAAIAGELVLVDDSEG